MVCKCHVLGVHRIQYRQHFYSILSNLFPKMFLLYFKSIQYVNVYSVKSIQYVNVYSVKSIHYVNVYSVKSIHYVNVYSDVLSSQIYYYEGIIVTEI